MSWVGGSRSELERDRGELTAQLSRVEASIENTKAELAARLKEDQSEAQRLRSRIGSIDAELQRREARDNIVPTISDHALLRYIERACGVDVETLKSELLTDAVVLAIKSGATGVRTPHGTMVIKGNTVVTFKSDDMDNRRRARVGRPRDEADEDGWADE